MGRHTIADMRAAHAAGGHFAVVTAWDRPTAEFAEAAGIHFMLVGDSLAQVALGHESTVRVGMSEMLHHTAAVVRSTSTALVIGDMPFGSYQVSPEDAVRSAVAELDPDAIPAREAVRLFEALERIVRSASAARTLLVHRVDDSMEWKRRGFRSAAEFVASRSGTSLAAARRPSSTSSVSTRPLRAAASASSAPSSGAISPSIAAIV